MSVNSDIYIYIYIYSNSINFSADMDPTLILFRKSLDSPPHFGQLTKVHCTFANTSPEISPIGEIPSYFRQYTPGTFAIGECLIGENPATPRIAIIIDNATLHNELVDETEPPKRLKRKDHLQKWLEEHGIIYDTILKKAELLEIAPANVPPNRYKTSAVTNVSDIELVRLLIKHCVLNPIELAWAQLKTYVRSDNSHFRFSDIRSLSEEYIAGLHDETSHRFIDQARKAEEIFCTADDFVEEEIEPY